ncbi:MAG: HAMP domain-containing histidine kinase [Clostridia bacterium]|nr:HAMP domain-containing histidine kinase [Clostridia bacterium]
MSKKASLEFWINVLIIEAISLAISLFIFFACNFCGNGINHSNMLNILLFMLCFIVFILLSISVSIYKINTISKHQFAEYQAVINSLQNEVEKQNKMADNLTKLYNSMAEYDNYKTEFFSNISHDIKTPLTVILGTIQLMDQNMAKAPLEKRKPNKHLQTIKHNCYRLLRLVNNILDISRIDSGYIKLNLTNVNIVYIVEEITQSVVPYAEQKNLSLEFDTEQEEIITAVDIDKVERVILNLLSNAIKFTPPGGKIQVSIYERNRQVVISVKDTGYGIPQNKLGIIFDRFKQSDSSLTRDTEGSGIGLSLVKSFIDLHSGSISVQSEESRGSEFLVELPIRLCEAQNHTGARHQNMQGKIVEAINIEFSDIYSSAS